MQFRLICRTVNLQEYEVPVSIEVPDGVELEKQPTIKVKLTEKEDETDQKADKKSDSTQEKSEK